MEESLPNIIGSVDKGLGGLGLLNGNIVDATQQGALSITTRTLTHAFMMQSIASYSGNSGVGFNASRSSTVYKDKAHARPLSIATAFLIRY